MQVAISGIDWFCSFSVTISAPRFSAVCGFPSANSLCVSRRSSRRNISLGDRRPRLAGSFVTLYERRGTGLVREGHQPCHSSPLPPPPLPFLFFSLLSLNQAESFSAFVRFPVVDNRSPVAAICTDLSCNEVEEERLVAEALQKAKDKKENRRWTGREIRRWH